MKNSRDNVIAAIEFGTPDRLPVVFDAFGVSDVQSVSWNQIGTGDSEKRLTYDEWNCGWSRSAMKNMGQVTVHPLYDWSQLQGYCRSPSKKANYVRCFSRSGSLEK
ncbi:MAG: hypothetical protein HN368_13080 [Spirochaetales bacterium]|jgi:hypothetical protein|nr:hypothetical protein [Spirochaetales bacterium]